MKTPTITAKIPADAWATLVKLVPQYAAYAVADKRRGFKRSPLIPGTVAESPFYVQTRSEVLEAYADCVGEQNEDTNRRRNLYFKSTHPVTVAEACALLTKATPEGYNEFKGSLIAKLPVSDGRKVWLAREGSVCIYVTGPEMPGTMQTKLKADEFDFYPDKYVKTYGENKFTISGPVTRIWWD
jgi:hypothetical protein